MRGIGTTAATGVSPPRSAHRIWRLGVQAGTPVGPSRQFRVELLAPTELAAWDAFVEKHPLGSIYHLSCWKAAIEAAFAHIQGHVLVVRNPATGQIEAGLPIYRVRSWLLGNRLVSVPWAEYCDPLVSEHCDLQALLSGAIDTVGASDVRLIEFRPWRTASQMQALGLQPRNLYLHHFLRLDRSLEEIKKACSRTCVRQWINKAERQGITLRPVTSPADFEAFYRIMTETRREHSLPPIPQRFFAALRDHLPSSHRELVLGLHQDRPLGAVLGLKYKNLFCLEYAGQLAEGRAMGVNQWLYWDALVRARQAGCELFSFGRTSAQNIPLRDFKRHWGTTEEDLLVLAVGKAEGSRGGYRSRWLVNRFTRALIGHAPGALYRWLGDFCYHHWG